MDLTTLIFTRDLVPAEIARTTLLLPQSYSFSVLGGPDQASIELGGSLEAIWEAVEWLRCPLNIYDARATMVWWGYIHELRIRSGAIEYGVSLDSMANRVAVVYESLPAGWAAAGTGGITSYAEDTDSHNTYGHKERIETITDSNQTEAEQVRDRILADLKYPIPLISVVGGEQPVSGELICRGWWQTLGWQYYTNTGTDDVATTTQISDIIAAFNTGGSWLNATAQIDNASGITANEYRDGLNTCLAEIEALLAKGTTSDKRLLAEVKLDRVVRVYQEPTSAATTDYFITSDGRLFYTNGMAVEPHTCPVGIWVRLQDIIPDTADLTRVANPSPFFVDRSEYNVRDGSLRLEPKSQKSVWDVGRIGEG